MKREPCRCGHAKSVHHSKGPLMGKVRKSPCWLVGCKCKDYTPVKEK